MRGQLTFKIEGFDKQIEVRELTTKQIISLFQFSGLDKVNSWSDVMNYLHDQILPMATNLTPDELLDFAPSDLKTIVDKFKKVNETFFGLTRTPMVTKVFEEIKPKILGAFGDSFAGLSKMDTSMLKSMDTLTSLMHSIKDKNSEQKE